VCGSRQKKLPRKGLSLWLRSRIKRFNGGKLTARAFGAQRREIGIQIAALNRMIRAVKPTTIRVAW
jgi:hypothetical protein